LAVPEVASHFLTQRQREIRRWAVGRAEQQSADKRRTRPCLGRPGPFMLLHARRSISTLGERSDAPQNVQNQLYNLRSCTAGCTPEHGAPRSTVSDIGPVLSDHVAVLSSGSFRSKKLASCPVPGCLQGCNRLLHSSQRSTPRGPTKSFSRKSDSHAGPPVIESILPP